jgi:hypothetical protein
MSLFGNRCVRCGERTHQHYLDKPTCTPCRDVLEIALAEATEQRRACPADATSLKKAIAHGVIIDQCPTCGGVWLDPGELERVNSEVVQHAALSSGFVRPLT